MNFANVTCITVVVEFEPSASLILERGRRGVQIDRLGPGAEYDHPITLQPQSAGRHHIAIVNFSFRVGSGRAHYEADRKIDVMANPVAESSAPAAARVAPTRSRTVQHLQASLPGWRIYFDRQRNRPGEDFETRIDSQLQRGTALLALIGPDWATAPAPDGRRRIDHDDDVLRREVATALRRRILVVPVLFNGAVMPNRADLPTDLRQLADRHAVEVSLKHFEHDVNEIASELCRFLGTS